LERRAPNAGRNVAIYAGRNHKDEKITKNFAYKSVDAHLAN
jgi:hypothetical protein